MAHNFKSEVPIDWCPGCGDFGIVSALTQAMGELDLDPKGVVAVSGIGCSGKTPHYLNIAGVHTLHGRALPYATGVKLANPNLKVLVTGGDGDLMGIGAGHLVAEGRRNSGLTILLYDNAVYGLTKGQAAPTLALGEQTKSLPRPNIFGKVNPITLALTTGYTFVARGFTSDIKQLKEIIKKGMQHEGGSSLIDILQPCPTYNNINTMDFFRKRVYKLEDDKEWDPVITEKNVEQLKDKFTSAYQKGLEWGDRIPTGVFLDNRTVPPFTERISKNLPDYLTNPPSNQTIAGPDGYTLVNAVETFKDRLIH